MIPGTPNTYPLQTSAQKLAGKLVQRPPLEKEMVSSIQKFLVGSMQRFGRKATRLVVIAFVCSSESTLPIDLYQGCKELEWNVY